ncbi:hypothetical protein ATEIFO6365_0015008000 [Aspergillus terreus]|uniref:Uncharacterized protein n=1 Tax=Aspergillus terreus TaxID=33178 RepID=A0A5M3ZD25_ASPTE|nr:hypothetical protein ATETN484_0016008000 [Aspergillus terreus]GFF21509.1 hypothetical protein ATEIFO6365_0015008000 [Aspergillus terreus]
MSHLSGNAWAIQARERERHSQEGDSIKDIEPIVSNQSDSRPDTSRKSSGLDYDQELALPMPKPRHVPIPDGEETTAHSQKASVLTKALTKRRNTNTESSQSEGTEQKGEGDKKPSRMAVLRSKFSLKDIGKDFRKDNPLTSMPSLPKDSMLQSERKSAGIEGNYHEARLYMPKARASDAQPSSAPPFQTTTFIDMGVHNNNENPMGVSQNFEAITVDGKMDKGKKAVCDVAYFDESPVLGKAEPMQHVQTVLLDGSSPLARTGEFSNEGHAEIVNSDHRVSSMKAEGESFAAIVNKPPVIPAAASPYVPSVKTSAEIEKQSVATLDDHAAEKKNEKKYPLVVSSQKGSSVASSAGKSYSPFIVSSDQATAYNKYYPAVGQPAAFSPAVSTFDPLHNVQNDAPYNTQTMTMNYDAYYAGVTSQGGYAPPPPQEGYQNTVTLEQHVATQADAIHHHLDSALQRVTRDLENSNNRVTDQLSKNVDNMWELLRSVNLRSMGHADAIKELQRLLIDVRMQLGAMQRENRQLEDRVMTIFHTEISKVRADISALSSGMNSVPYNPVMVARPVTELQGPDGFQRGVRDGERKMFNNRKAKRVVKKDEEEMGGKEEESERNNEHNNNKGAAGDFLNKRAEPEQTPGTDILSSSADVRAEPVDITNKNDVFTRPAGRRTILKNPARISTGSPEPKATASLKRAVLTSTVEPENGNGQGTSNENVKTPSRRGLWSLRRSREDDKSTSCRFLQTPRRNRQNNNKASAEMQKARPATPQTKSAPASPRSQHDRVSAQHEESPSSIHPALRNPRQRQIMAERERQAQTAQQQQQQNIESVVSSQRPDLRAQMPRPVIHVNLPVATHYPYAGIAYGAVPMMYQPQLAARPNVNSMGRAHMMPRFGAVADAYAYAQNAQAAVMASRGLPPAPGYSPPSVPDQENAQH